MQKIDMCENPHKSVKTAKLSCEISMNFIENS